MSSPQIDEQQLLLKMEREVADMRRNLAEREAIIKCLRDARNGSDASATSHSSSSTAATTTPEEGHVEDLTRSFRRLNSDSNLHAAADAEQERRIELDYRQKLKRQGGKTPASQLADLLAHTQEEKSPAAAAAPLEPLLKQILDQVHQVPVLPPHLRDLALSEMETQQRVQRAQLETRNSALESLMANANSSRSSSSSSAPQRQQQQQQRQHGHSIVDMLDSFTEEPASFTTGQMVQQETAASAIADLRAALRRQQLSAGGTAPPQLSAGGTAPPPLPVQLPLPQRSASNGSEVSGDHVMSALQKLLEQQKQQQQQHQPAQHHQPFPMPHARPAGATQQHQQQQQLMHHHQQQQHADSLHMASAQHLGSKRDRPDSMVKFTEFRDSNRVRTAPSPPSSMAPAPALAAVMAAASAAPAAASAAASAAVSDCAPAPPRSKASAARVSNPAPQRWTPEEDKALAHAVGVYGPRNWKAIAEMVPNRSHVQCLQRWNKALDPSVVKGHWTTEEDAQLLRLVAENPKNWGHVARGVPGRNAKQCRERYLNHLDPSIKKGDWTPEEDEIIVTQQRRLGNRWAEIASLLPGRPENSVKIRWKSIQRYSLAQLHRAAAANNAAGTLGG